MSGKPLDAAAWIGRTKLTVKPSKTSTFIRWCATQGSAYAVISHGKQTNTYIFIVELVGKILPGFQRFMFPQIRGELGFDTLKLLANLEEVGRPFLPNFSAAPATLAWSFASARNPRRFGAFCLD